MLYVRQRSGERDYAGDARRLDCDRAARGECVCMLNRSAQSALIAGGSQVGITVPVISVCVINDTDDADTNDGHCDTDLGTSGDQCTLRAAIQHANAFSSCGPITIEATGVTGVISLATPLPNVQHDVTILGSGSGNLRVDGQGNNRIFRINL